MALSPADVAELDDASQIVPLAPLLDSDLIPVLREMPLQSATVADFRQAMNNSVGSLRFYGGAPGAPDAGETLFEIPMNGDEIFDVGLPGSLVLVDTAPTNPVSFPITVNGVSVGQGSINAGAKVGAFTFATQPTSPPPAIS